MSHTGEVDPPEIYHLAPLGLLVAEEARYRRLEQHEKADAFKAAIERLRRFDDLLEAAIALSELTGIADYAWDTADYEARDKADDVLAAVSKL
jgi:hypothetical protein